MKLFNIRTQWAIEGRFITLIEAGVAPTKDELLAYWDLRPANPRYAAHAAPHRFSRYVLLKDNGSFVVIPFTPDVREYAS